ncbi:MAG: ribosome biogenesis GTPase Der [Fusobacteria bacterium]|nr:ribosome biogenesis GTPase Der [Fusobacteriota bacterium]
MKPIVAIVGRPNVGKSTLFNKLVGDKIAIVENIPGVTRDRLYRDCEWQGKEFLLVDTGGLEPNNKEFLMEKIKFQAKIAIDEADTVIFVVDGTAGVTALDEDIAVVLRSSHKKIIVAVNKVDSKDREDLRFEFYALGFEEVIAVSAEHKNNLGDLLDIALSNINMQEFIDPDGIKIAIVGKPNAGKSSLTNALCNEERTIVSPIAGTTRDAIDTTIKYKNQDFVLIDTAGIRRKSKVEEDLEYYSVLRAIKAIKRADVVILMIDAIEGLTEQDKKIAGLIHDENKPVIVTVNKWDLITKDNFTMNEFTKEFKAELLFLQYAPIMFISALTRQRITTVLDKSQELFTEYHKRISTGILNNVLHEITTVRQVPTRKGQVVKIKYITQIGEAPPTFALFANKPELIHFSYLRYLENQFREYFGFDGVPIKFVLRGKNEKVNN